MHGPFGYPFRRNNGLTTRTPALECVHVFEIDEASHYQSALDAKMRRVAA
jgi:hypothetical protein